MARNLLKLSIGIFSFLFLIIGIGAFLGQPSFDLADESVLLTQSCYQLSQVTEEDLQNMPSIAQVLLKCQEVTTLRD